MRRSTASGPSRPAAAGSSSRRRTPRRSRTAAWRAPGDLGGGRLAGYGVVLEDAGRAEPVRAIATDAASASFDGLEPGRYAVRVRAVTDGGAGPAVSRTIELGDTSAQPAAGHESTAAATAATPKPRPQPGRGRQAAGLRVLRASVRNGSLR